MGKTKIEKVEGILVIKGKVVGQMIIINLPLFSTVVQAIIFVFLSCRPFVAITTLSTGFVGVEVTSVSWLEQLTVGV